MNIHVLWLAEQAAKESKDAVDAVMTEDGKKVIQEVVKTANEEDPEFRILPIIIGSLVTGLATGVGKQVVKSGGRGMLKGLLSGGIKGGGGSGGTQPAGGSAIDSTVIKEFMKNDAPKLPKDNFDANRFLEAGMKPPKLPEQHRMKPAIDINKWFD